MEKLEELRVGDWVRWGGSEWEVTDRNTYAKSGAYNEIHWKLEPDMGQERYLVMSKEDKGASVEEICVCTREAVISDVEYKAQSGQWQAFRETDSLSEAPATIRFKNLEFNLQGETSGTDEDDDGNTVTTLTWDYYDSSHSRNIAIEIWKEPDADYFEAYDGNVTKPSDFELLPPRAATITKSFIKESVPAVILFLFSCAFALPLLAGILNVCNIGGEYVFACAIPVLFILIAGTLASSRNLLGAALAAAIITAMLLIKFRGLGASYWEYSLYGAIAGPALASIMGTLFPGAGRWDKPLAAANATMLLLWIISFAHYITSAPQPHNPGVLFAACALPLAPAALVLALYKVKEAVNERPSA
ncbi:MAG TPA: hypothetical protein DCL44_01475 [Elusimicrobia bacterium]|nr:hypothetical protein [Elusimicrobiota bacterium]